jgi:Lrp/AsnC family transcriptional regulator, leucine-responsive regulatory protein
MAKSSSQTTEAVPLDHIDEQLLARLQQDGRVPVAQLAREVHLSVTPCLERVRRLEASGVIRGYHAELDPQRLGQQLLAYIEVSLDRTTPDVFDHFRSAMQALEIVQECCMVAGGFDYLLKIRVRDMQEFRRVLGDEIAGIRGVQQTHTYFVMEEVKNTNWVRIERRAAE